ERADAREGERERDQRLCAAGEMPSRLARLSGRRELHLDPWGIAVGGGTAVRRYAGGRACERLGARLFGCSFVRLHLVAAAQDRSRARRLDEAKPPLTTRKEVLNHILEVAGRDLESSVE